MRFASISLENYFWLHFARLSMKNLVKHIKVSIFCVFALYVVSSFWTSQLIKIAKSQKEQNWKFAYLIFSVDILKGKMTLKTTI